MTARQHCASRRVYCFNLAPSDSAPSWRKLHNGYIGVADGTPQNYIAPGLIFAIEIHDNTPQIYTYRKRGVGAAIYRPYTLKSLYQILKNPDNLAKSPISFDDMIAAVKSFYPDIYTPTPFQFFAEYGQKFDSKTGNISNFINADNDF
jgi:hypothetical protein